MAFGKMNPDFNVTGTSTQEKRDRAVKALDARIENLKLAFGLDKDHKLSDAQMRLIGDVAEAEMYRAHWQGQVDKAEAERKAREEAARKAEEQRKVMEDLLRRFGGDFNKVLEAIRNVAPEAQK